MYEKLVRRLLSLAGIDCDGNNPWDIQVHDGRFYRRVLFGGSLGFGESYLEGWWSCPRVDLMFERLLDSGISDLVPRFDELKLKLLSGIFDLQSRTRGHRVAREHYDLDPDFFMGVLGETNSYTCARFVGTDDLDAAQRLKMDIMCRKAGLQKGMTVLDIGCGWGGFLSYATEKYGVRGIGYSISEQQLGYARNRYGNLPIDFRHCDYRDIRDNGDAAVSICMIEHVGGRYYGEYFDVIRRALPKHGLFVMQCIIANRIRSISDPWLNKYIFPSGTLVYLQWLKEAASGIMHLLDEEHFGHDYVKTLHAWYANLRTQKDTVVEKYGMRHYRMYEYYFMLCVAGFLSKRITVAQLVFSPTDLRESYRPVRL